MVMAGRGWLGGRPARSGINLVAVEVGPERIGQQTTNTRIARNGSACIIAGWFGFHKAILAMTG